MKKFVYTIATILMMVSLAIAFNACGDDNSEPESPDTEKTVEESALSVSIYVNQAMADTYDVHGKSFLGQDINLSSTPVEVTVKGKKTPMYFMTLVGTSNAVPLSAILNVTFTLKDGYEVPEKSDFALVVSASGSIVYTDGTNTNIAAQGYELENVGVFGSQIDDYTANLNKNFGRIKATLDHDGIVLDTSSN